MEGLGFSFGQALQKILREFTPPSGVRLFQYVDYLLLSGEHEKVVEETTVKLLNFLAKKGLRVSEKKTQLVGEKKNQISGTHSDWEVMVY